MRERMRRVRERLAAADSDVPGLNLAALANQNGLFAVLPLSKAQIASLREDPRFESIMARFEPQGRVGKFFDTFNGPKRGVGLLEGLKNIIDS